MLRRTGSGRVSEQRSGGNVRGLLYNFDIDGYDLKPEHTYWLNVTALPLLERHPFSYVWITGTTSRTASSQHNQQLSQRRAAQVANYLETRRVSRSQICTNWARINAVGESFSTSPLEEDEVERAVIVEIQPIVIHTPSPVPHSTRPPSPPPRPIVSQSFSIRMRFGGSLGHIIVGVDAVYFDILDETNNYVASYRYLGANISIGTPASGTPRGPWNHFFIPRPLSCGQFTGWGMMGSMGGLQYTRTYLMVPTPEGMPNVRIAPFNTAPTMGVGWSPLGAGRFTLIDPPHPRRPDEW
jgi:hypothetical protein